ncbi:LytTR family DNA-binding domain-containing protein [Aquisalimonas lutea]|uniref:LytR/AlgR family response regulator transcription factor n=1 Tax=Aquisalimonas lutea TaxID=1327750 RepID=UPI0025B2EE8A|nr:LytTR family DNA-binding domain-containing protein [Aquisalimonas lutea]MDN3516672.1 LytTR family DNA-binding domain-containing protein [Aquisalimonas lutea]
MRILIVDDEAPARERLAQHVTDLGGHEVVAGARDGDEAIRLASRHQPDVVLMDIRMPGTDGVAAARALAEADAPPAVIFVTAYGEHALAAFDAEAVDYLVKPVRRDRLARALERARRVTRPQLDALGGTVQGADDGARAHILCRRRGVLELVPVADIHYFQADNKYVTVCHAEGEDLIEESLRQLEGEFGDRFVRIHRNALVARDRLGRLEHGAGGRRYLVLRGLQKRLEVSRRHAGQVRDLLEHLGER